MKEVEVTLAAAVADDGTFNVSYPSGTNQAFFTGGNASATGQMVVNDNDVYEESGADTFAVLYDTSVITVTNETGATLAAGTKLRLGFAYADEVYAFAGQKSAAITSLTDSSTGTASDTLAALADLSTSNTYTDAALNAKLAIIKNAIASLAAKIEAITVALEKGGIIES